MLKRLLSITLSLSLVWTSGNVAEVAASAPELFPAPANLPQFQPIPPKKLGRIVDYFNGGRLRDTAITTQPLVTLTQALHAHYGVQKNIPGLLDFLSQKLTDSAA